MSKTAAITIKASIIDALVYQKVINSLLFEGWTINKDQHISYMLNDTYDWNVATIEHSEEVFSLIEKSVNANLATSIDLVWKDAKTCIAVTYIDETTLMFSVTESLKIISDIPVLDFSWYFEKMSSLFNCLKISRIECSYG